MANALKQTMGGPDARQRLSEASYAPKPLRDGPIRFAFGVVIGAAAGLLVAGLMGAGSLVGVLIGAALLPYVDRHTLKRLLGVILLIATACISLPGFTTQKTRPSTRLGT
jgi:uncharacterized membrane protein YfcA